MALKLTDLSNLIEDALVLAKEESLKLEAKKAEKKLAARMNAAKKNKLKEAEERAMFEELKKKFENKEK